MDVGRELYIQCNVVWCTDDERSHQLGAQIRHAVTSQTPEGPLPTFHLEMRWLPLHPPSGAWRESLQRLWNWCSPRLRQCNCKIREVTVKEKSYSKGVHLFTLQDKSGASIAQWCRAMQWSCGEWDTMIGRANHYHALNGRIKSTRHLPL